MMTEFLRCRRAQARVADLAYNYLRYGAKATLSAGARGT